MSAIAKCTGERSDNAWSTTKCPFRYSCRRFTAGAAPQGQEWLKTAPYSTITHSCREYVSTKPAQIEEART